jgi:hypothetical protein
MNSLSRPFRDQLGKLLVKIRIKSFPMSSMNILFVRKNLHKNNRNALNEPHCQGKYEKDSLPRPVGMRSYRGP